VDQLSAGRDSATVFQSGGLIDELKKRLAGRMLNAEIDHHRAARLSRSRAITATAMAGRLRKSQLRRACGLSVKFETKGA
jgi:putative transposase